jgi:hypothetical protein
MKIVRGNFPESMRLPERANSSPIREFVQLDGIFGIDQEPSAGQDLVA